MNILIQHGTVVSPELGEFRGDVLIENGKIKTISSHIPAPDGVEVIDATGKHVFPGFIDPHVHLGNYNPFLDDVKTETRAAAAGGVTTLIHFLKSLAHRKTNAPYSEIIDEVVEQINAHSFIDVAMHCAISTEQQIAEIPQFVEQGLIGQKFYMGYKNDPQAVRRGSVGSDDGTIFLGYQKVAEVGAPALAMTHCENEEVAQALMKRLRGEGREYSFKEFADTRPNFIEAETIFRAITLARMAGCPLYVVHCSSKEGLEMIKKMRHETDVRIWAEVTTHHLMLSVDYCETLPDLAIAKTTPPQRTQESLDALWEGIRDGTVDTVGTDHCAMKPHNKVNLDVADPGFPGMDLFPALVLTEAKRRGIDLQTMAKVTSHNAAKIFQLYPAKGSFRPGSDGDVAIVDLDTDWTYDASQAYGSTGFSPFDGWRLSARVTATIQRGNVIFRDGSFTDDHRGQALVREQGVAIV